MREPCVSVRTRVRARSVRFGRLDMCEVTFDTPHSQQQTQRSNLPLRIETGKTYRRIENVTWHAASLTTIKDRGRQA